MKKKPRFRNLFILLAVFLLCIFAGLSFINYSKVLSLTHSLRTIDYYDGIDIRYPETDLLMDGRYGHARSKVLYHAKSESRYIPISNDEFVPEDDSKIFSWKLEFLHPHASPLQEDFPPSGCSTRTNSYQLQYSICPHNDNNNVDITVRSKQTGRNAHLVINYPVTFSSINGEGNRGLKEALQVIDSLHPAKPFQIKRYPIKEWLVQQIERPIQEVCENGVKVVPFELGDAFVSKDFQKQLKKPETITLSYCSLVNIHDLDKYDEVYDPTCPYPSQEELQSGKTGLGSCKAKK